MLSQRRALGPNILALCRAVNAQGAALIDQCLVRGHISIHLL